MNKTPRSKYMYILANIITVFACYTMLQVSYLYDQAALKANSEIFYWFQRSGSLVVLVVIVSEIAIMKSLSSSNHILDMFEKHSSDKDGALVTAEKLRDNSTRPSHTITLVVQGLLAVLGTIIWGYGDLLFR